MSLEDIEFPIKIVKMRTIEDPVLERYRRFIEAAMTMAMDEALELGLGDKHQQGVVCNALKRAGRSGCLVYRRIKGKAYLVRKPAIGEV